MAQNQMPEGVKSVIMWTVGLASIALILLIMVIIFGNLSGNVGFSSGTQGYNDSQSLIQNYTLSATNTGAQFPTVGTILGISILLVILLGLLIYAITKMMAMTGGSGGKSNEMFG